MVKCEDEEKIQWALGLCAFGGTGVNVAKSRWPASNQGHQNYRTDGALTKIFSFFGASLGSSVTSIDGSI